MNPTWLVAIVLSASIELVPAPPEVSKVPGPYIQIPWKGSRTADVGRVQLYVSDNRGGTWNLWADSVPDERPFTFWATRPGEYWFSIRVKKKDGTLHPANPANFTPSQKVTVETGTEPTPNPALVELLRSPPPPGITSPTKPYYFNSQNIRLPIKYLEDRKTIRKVLLFVARNGGNTWFQEAAVSPDQDAFTYLAREDGTYSFTIVIEYLDGRHDPLDLTRTPPDLKVILDTVPPRIQFTNAKRSGEKVVIEWLVDDKHPDENNTRVHFRPSSKPDGYWQEVTLPDGCKSGVQFPAGTAGPVIVRVTAYDLAGNKTEAVRAVPGSDVGTFGPPATPPIPAVILAGGTFPARPIPVVDELDDELNRLELELIRKELKLLAEKKRLSPEVEEKIDRLRIRLRDARERLGSDRIGGSSDPRILPAAVPLRMGGWFQPGSTTPTDALPIIPVITTASSPATQRPTVVPGTPER